MIISDECKLNFNCKKNRNMINNFLIINCTGNNNSIGLKSNNKFFIEKLQNNINSNNLLVNNIIKFLKTECPKGENLILTTVTKFRKKVNSNRPQKCKRCM